MSLPAAAQLLLIMACRYMIAVRGMWRLGLPAAVCPARALFATSTGPRVAPTCSQRLPAAPALPACSAKAYYRRGDASYALGHFKDAVRWVAA